MQAAIREFSGGATITPGRVTMDIPPLVENGNSVPLTITVDSPMTEKDFVKTIAVFNERNPQPNIGTFHLNARSGRACVSTRIRLGDSQTIVAVAQTHRRLALVGLGGADRHPARVRGELTMARALINVPPKAKRGEIIEIKTLISHPMETGYRPKGDGTFFPRDIIQKFVCTLNGEEIFRADLYPGDRRQSVHRLHDGGARGRPAGVLVDRRPRRSADGIGEARGRMTMLAAAREAPDDGLAGWHSRALAQDADSRRSGFEDMSRESQAMQKDDTANPGMLWVLDGEALWTAKAGSANKSCADCHQDAATSMKGVAARYPAFSAEHQRPLDLQGRINACRETQQQAAPFAWESKELLALVRLCRQAVARHADRAAGRCAARTVPQARRSALQPARRATEFFLRQLSRRQRRAKARQRRDPARPPDRLPALPPRMAGHRLAAAPPARLLHRRARRAVSLTARRSMSSSNCS